jgi:hypothetical protein|tara:strand:- start:23 stop:250 length:228 start_codon:yes stop_codon:yes gene_type:complete
MNTKNIDKAQLKLILSLEMKIQTILEQTEKKILDLKKKNIHSPEISPEEASYNVGAIDHLTKVVKLLRKDSKDFA